MELNDMFVFPIQPFYTFNKRYEVVDVVTSKTDEFSLPLPTGSCSLTDSRCVGGEGKRRGAKQREGACGVRALCAV